MQSRPSWFSVEFDLQISSFNLNANFDVWNKWFGFIRKPGLVQLEFLKFQFTYIRESVLR